MKDDKYSIVSVEMKESCLNCSIMFKVLEAKKKTVFQLKNNYWSKKNGSFRERRDLNACN